MKIMHQRFFVRLFATVIMVRRFIMNSELTVINQEFLTGERALFNSKDLKATKRFCLINSEKIERKAPLYIFLLTF